MTEQHFNPLRQKMGAGLWSPRVDGASRVFQQQEWAQQVGGAVRDRVQRAEGGEPPSRPMQLAQCPLVEPSSIPIYPSAPGWGGGQLQCCLLISSSY